MVTLMILCMTLGGHDSLAAIEVPSWLMALTTLSPPVTLPK